jgi:pimeloyl-ACP methyl ester carboxylesterase
MVPVSAADSGVSAPRTVALARDEVPLYFPAGEDQLFGVLTNPVADDSGIGVLLLSGGVYVLSTNRNRLFVRFARRLSADGHRSLRMDYRGVGESTGVIGRYALDDPSVVDVQAGLDQLTDAGARRIVVIGSCYGARAGMHAAVSHPALAAMVLLAPPVGDEGRGDAATADQVGALFVAGLTTLHRRGVPTLLIYGRDDDSYRDLSTAMVRPPLSGLFGAGSTLTVRTLAGKAHGLQRIDIQDSFLTMALHWIATAVGGTGADAG